MYKCKWNSQRGLIRFFKEFFARNDDEREFGQLDRNQQGKHTTFRIY